MDVRRGRVERDHRPQRGHGGFGSALGRRNRGWRAGNPVGFRRIYGGRRAGLSEREMRGDGYVRPIHPERLPRQP